MHMVVGRIQCLVNVGPRFSHCRADITPRCLLCGILPHQGRKGENLSEDRNHDLMQPNHGSDIPSPFPLSTCYK